MFFNGGYLSGDHDPRCFGRIPDRFGSAAYFYRRYCSLCHCDASHGRSVRYSASVAKHKIFKGSEDHWDCRCHPDRAFSDRGSDLSSFISGTVHGIGCDNIGNLLRGRNILEKKRLPPETPC